LLRAKSRPSAIHNGFEEQPKYIWFFFYHIF
jgi:hypothetical protein